MKRYSVSVLYLPDRFQYAGRVDSVEVAIVKFKDDLSYWRESVLSECPYACSRCGVRVTDSVTKQVVFEEIHSSEELGYKKCYEELPVTFGYCRKPYWVKL